MTNARDLNRAPWLRPPTKLPLLLSRVLGLGLTSGVLLLAQQSPPVQSVTFKSSDGLKIYGALYQPKGDGPFPAIVRVHGGISGHAHVGEEDYFVDTGF